MTHRRLCCCDPLVACDFGPCSSVSGEVTTRNTGIVPGDQCADADQLRTEFTAYWASTTPIPPGTIVSGSQFVDGQGAFVGVTRHIFNGSHRTESLIGNPNELDGPSVLTIYESETPFRLSNSDPQSFPLSRVHFVVSNGGLTSASTLAGAVSASITEATCGRGEFTTEGHSNFCDFDYVNRVVAFDITSADNPLGSPAGPPQQVYPPAPPEGCPGGEDPPEAMVEGYIQPNGTGVRDTIGGAADWANRANAEGEPDDEFARCAMLLGLGGSRWFLGLMDFQDQLPAGRAPVGARLEIPFRFNKTPSAPTGNEAHLQAMRLVRDGVGVAGSERAGVTLQISPAFGVYVFGDDDWGMPPAFWTDPDTIASINNGSFGFEFWFDTNFPSPATPGQEYHLDIESAFMRINHQAAP